MQSVYSLVTKYAKNDIQKDVFLANYQRNLSEYDLENITDSAELIKVVTEWRMMLGIKEEATGDEMAYNCRFIKEEYQDFTIEKIKLAIKYSIRGLLNVDVKPYGSFSPLYISTILNAYRQYDSKVVADVLKEKHKSETISENATKEYSDEQKYLNRLEYLEYYKKECVNGYMTDFKDIAWSVLLKNNIVSEIELESFDIKKVANDLVEKENIKKDFTKSVLASETDLLKMSKYLVMVSKIKDVDFKTIEIL